MVLAGVGNGGVSETRLLDLLYCIFLLLSPPNAAMLIMIPCPTESNFKRQPLAAPVQGCSQCTKLCATGTEPSSSVLTTGGCIADRKLHGFEDAPATNDAS